MDPKNVLACLLAIVLLGVSGSGSYQSFVEGLEQPPHVTNQTYIMNESSNNSKEVRGTLGVNVSNNNKMSTTELGSPQGSLPSITQRTINELGNATSDEIATYPINDLSPEVLVNVLNGLSTDNLFKVLVNLPHDALKTLLLNTLVAEQSKQILNRLPQDKKAEIQTRMNS